MITAVNIDGGKGGQVRVFCGTLAQVLVPYGESAPWHPPGLTPTLSR
jgi:hypothetical protein